jgi:hypothetical protein
MNNCGEFKEEFIMKIVLIVFFVMSVQLSVAHATVPCHWGNPSCESVPSRGSTPGSHTTIGFAASTHDVGDQEKCQPPVTVTGSSGCYDNGSGYTEWVSTSDGSYYESRVSDCASAFNGCTSGTFVVGSLFQENNEDGTCVVVIGDGHCNRL